MKRVYLHLNDTYLGDLTIEQVRGHETWMFRYDEEYLERGDCPMLDPSIRPIKGPQFSENGHPFGFLCDAMPDRWGRKLMRRKYRRELFESDYLLGVHDWARTGALRIKTEKDGPFVDESSSSNVPPWTTLRKLEEAARHLDGNEAETAGTHWLQDLFAPGSSLGGARPKATVLAPDGSLWIAKFPSVHDEWNVGKREYETSLLARKIGLNVPDTQGRAFSKAGTTFLSKRFDRQGPIRIHYASAMTMLGATDGEEHAYLEIAEFIAANSAAATEDLHELWTRMAFSELVKNTDDHLRNHGFLLTAKGWRLSPLFDVNPNPNGVESALDRGDLIQDADYYRLTKREAQDRLGRIRQVVR